MRVGYVVKPKADWDIGDIADDLTDRAGIDLGFRFITAAYETFELLSSHPKMGWPCRIANPQLKDVRVFRVAAPFEKYLIFYRELDDAIDILRVVHGAIDLERRLSIEGTVS